MKTNLHYKLLAVLLLFTFGAKAQIDHTITLRCETEGINADNVTTKCRFDGQGDESTKDFTYDVTVGDSITWNAEGTEGERINVVRIGYLSGAQVFDWTEKGPPEGAGSVNGTTRREGNFTYSISIVIPGISEGVLTIDPIIKVGGL